MRMSKTHKIAVGVVTTTIAAATVLTFTRADTAPTPTEQVAALPEATDDSPVVAHGEPSATSKPRSTPKPSPSAAPPTEKAPAPTPKAAPTTAKPAPTSKPAPSSPSAPSPTPTPRDKNLLEILLGQ